MNKKYLFLPIIFASILYAIVSCNDDEYTAVDELPLAVNDVTTYFWGETATINALDNDTSGDAVVASSFSFSGGIDTDANGSLNRLTIANEGVWNVNQTGVVSFQPLETFFGNPTPVSYKVKDNQGNWSNEATITVTAIQSVSADLSQVPYPKLSDYKFFAGPIKNQNPSLGVLIYEPASSLFTDYAKKKRFVWMPTGSKATFNGEDKILELPVGAVIIKTFYYTNVVPNNSTRIIETRLMIRKSTGWIFAEYIWNEEQTDAFLQTNGATTSVTFIHDTGEEKTVSEYRMPSNAECLVCHKNDLTPIPIGIKPQNLNWNYNYTNGTQNQLSKWIQEGYLENNLPANISAVVNYKDTTKPLADRLRSYLDINCAHCHSEMGHCSYRPIRLAFNESTTPINLGICVPPQDPVGVTTNIITPSNVNRSTMHARMNTNQGNLKMPLIGRSVIHEEGVQLLRDYINSLSGCN